MRSFGFGFWVGLAAALLLTSLFRKREQTWAVELPNQTDSASTPVSSLTASPSDPQAGAWSMLP